MSRNPAALKQINGSDSLAFRAWLGESKVVDTLGRPLKVYHGTEHEFTTFHDGAFFTDDYMIADGYANGEIVLEVFLKIERPLVVDAKGRKWDDLKSKYGKSTRDICGNIPLEYDGVIFRNIKDSVIDDADYQDPVTVYFVRSGLQVKSVSHCGQFEPGSPSSLLDRDRAR